eukprot:3331412-Rhodomonas_salina.7
MPATFEATSSGKLKRVVRGFPEPIVASLHEAVEASDEFASKYKAARQSGTRRGVREKTGGNGPSDIELKGRIVQVSAEPLLHAVHSRLGLVSAIVAAYNQHFDLVLDPNEVCVLPPTGIVTRFRSTMHGTDEGWDGHRDNSAGSVCSIS